MLRYCHHWFCRSLDWLCSDVRWQQQVQLCTVLLSSSKVKREASSPKSNKWRAPRLSLDGSNGLFGSYAGAGTTHIGDQPRPGWYVQPAGGGGLDQPCSSQMDRVEADWFFRRKCGVKLPGWWKFWVLEIKFSSCLLPLLPQCQGQKCWNDSWVFIVSHLPHPSFMTAHQFYIRSSFLSYLLSQYCHHSSPSEH